MSRMYNVEDIYNYCKDENQNMLSNYSADFWEVYRNNSHYFDRLFMKTYRSFIPFNSQEDSLDRTADAFGIDVYSWLLANDKRYSELWRMQIVSDVDYSMLDNYNVRETHQTSANSNKTDTTGSRQDTKSSTFGYGTITKRDEKTNVNGARSESDNRTLSYDSVETNTSVDTTIGSQQNTVENKVSADNVNTYSPKDYSDTDLGSREDSSDTHEIISSRTDRDNNQHTEASYTDTERNTGTVEHANDTSQEQTTYGSHTDTHRGEESENKTVTRKGNIGVYSASKLLGEHRDLWESFNFYKFVFDEIANEFLRIIY